MSSFLVLIKDYILVENQHPNKQKPTLQFFLIYFFFKALALILILFFFGVGEYGGRRLGATELAFGPALLVILT